MVDNNVQTSQIQPICFRRSVYRWGNNDLETILKKNIFFHFIEFYLLFRCLTYYTFAYDVIQSRNVFATVWQQYFKIWKLILIFDSYEKSKKYFSKFLRSIFVIIVVKILLWCPINFISSNFELNQYYWFYVCSYK